MTYKKTTFEPNQLQTVTRRRPNLASTKHENHFDMLYVAVITIDAVSLPLHKDRVQQERRLTCYNAANHRY